MIENIFSSLEVRECNYKGEHYSAREDGMIMRHCRIGVRKRKCDGVWTYGIPNASTGYMDFCGERVHRIVVTAFHGEAPTDQHVVDHIDTNRRNNRPDNLRWLTKLENILNNEITRRKIELICGSVEAFLENPQLLRGYESADKNFLWMKNVTKQEAQNCLANWYYWAKTAKPNPNYKRGELHVDSWIYSKPNYHKENDGYRTFEQYTPAPIVQENKDEEENLLTDSLTPSAKQRNWHTPTEFPCCPSEVTNDGLNIYLLNLKIGDVFSLNNKYSPYYVVDKGMGKDNKTLVVFSTDNRDAFLSWAITTISIENGKYVHENTFARGEKELTEHLFKYIIGQGELTEDEIAMLECL